MAVSIAFSVPVSAASAVASYVFLAVLFFFQALSDGFLHVLGVSSLFS